MMVWIMVIAVWQCWYWTFRVMITSWLYELPKRQGDAITQLHHACTSSTPIYEARRPRAGTSPHRRDSIAGGLSGCLLVAAAIEHMVSFVETTHVMPAVMAFLVSRRVLGSLGPLEKRRRTGPTKEHAEAVTTIWGACWWSEESLSAGEGYLLRS